MRSATKKESFGKECAIQINLEVDGEGEAELSTPVPFLDHMLNSFIKHGMFDLNMKVEGCEDPHVLVDIIGRALGEAFSEALGDKSGCNRFGHALVPMDESLATVVVDLSGRGILVYKAPIGNQVDGFNTQLIEVFFNAFANAAGITLHVKVEGENDHHKIEGLFKALGVAMWYATRQEETRGVPSTKGYL